MILLEGRALSDGKMGPDALLWPCPRAICASAASTIPPDHNPVSDITPQGVIGVAYGDEERTVEGSAVHHFDAGSRNQAKVSQVLEHLGFLALNPHDFSRSPQIKRGEWLGGRNRPVYPVYWIPVGTGVWKSACQELLNFLRYDVFILAGFIMGTFPREAYQVSQQALCQPVSADKLSGLFSPFVGERHADSRCIFNQTFRGEVAAHFANGRATYTQSFHELGKRHSSRGIYPVDLFEVFFLAFKSLGHSFQPPCRQASPNTWVRCQRLFHTYSIRYAL
jgi:hypothetical protein